LGRSAKKKKIEKFVAYVISRKTPAATAEQQQQQQQQQQQ
jgi:hypothetical protein